MSVNNSHYFKSEKNMGTCTDCALENLDGCSGRCLTCYRHRISGLATSEAIEPFKFGWNENDCGICHGKYSSHYNEYFKGICASCHKLGRGEMTEAIIKKVTKISNVELIKAPLDKARGRQKFGWKRVEGDEAKFVEEAVGEYFFNNRHHVSLIPGELISYIADAHAIASLNVGVSERINYARYSFFHHDVCAAPPTTSWSRVSQQALLECMQEIFLIKHTEWSKFHAHTDKINIKKYTGKAVKLSEILASDKYSIERFCGKLSYGSKCPNDLFSSLEDLISVFPVYFWRGLARYAGPAYTGIPDLMVWNDSSLKLVEVKAPGDELRGTQISFFSSAAMRLSINIEICKVIRKKDG